jgi:hypothetical protein
LQVPRRSQVPALHRLENPAPQPPYPLLVVPPVHLFPGITVENRVRVAGSDRGALPRLLSVGFPGPPAEPGVPSGRPPARSLLGRAFSVGPPPNRTCPVKWHPALQCSSWALCRTSGVDVLVAGAADDQGLAAAGSHPRGPFRWVLAPFGIEVLEGAYVVHLNLFG